MHRFAYALLLAALAACGDARDPVMPGDPDVPDVPSGLTVEVSGPDRLKAGDRYQFRATVRDAGGNVVQAPVTWRVVEAGRGGISASGLLTPKGSGPVTVQATVAGGSGTESADVYDWEPIIAPSVIGAVLRADAPIVNRHDHADLPTLFVGCGAGTFFVVVAFERTVAAEGGVAWMIDDGEPESGDWIHLADRLAHPGPVEGSMAFGEQLAAGKLFEFAFLEHLAGAHLVPFRLTGLQQLIGPMLELCEAQNGPGVAAPYEAVRSTLAATRSTTSSAIRR